MKYAHAVITGASSGFGAAFARRLAGECAHLVLVARRGEVMQALADELRAAHPGVEVTVRPCDLSDDTARCILAEEMTVLPEGRLLLVNNAGLGDYGEYAQSMPERNRQMLQVNVVRPPRCRCFLMRLAPEMGEWRWNRLVLPG